MGKINMCLYQMLPSILENIYNPDGLSLLLKYLPTIKTNPFILILAYPEWSVLPTAIFTTNATSICSYLHTLTHTLSLSRSLHCLAHFPLLSLLYKYDNCACFWLLRFWPEWSADTSLFHLGTCLQYYFTMNIHHLQPDAVFISFLLAWNER